VACNAADVATIQAQLNLAGIRLIGQSTAFISMMRVLHRIAESDATVLVEGETGTGKELAARAVHYLGGRRAFPFIAINCGALPEALVENELFGHSRGAYTHASSAAPGLLHLGNRGTLFLDEIEALPLRGQTTLLRFLEDHRFRPLGARDEEESDVRIIAASNLDLLEQVQKGAFRRDLYYRLNLLAVRLPPLRTRDRDPVLLAIHFLTELRRRYQNQCQRLHRQTLEWFQAYGWPGNIRELENLIHREFLLSDDEELVIVPPAAVASVPADWRAPDEQPAPACYRAAKARAVDAFNRGYLTQLMACTGGNVTRAAQLANKERRAFGRLLQRYAIRPTSRNDAAAEAPDGGATPGHN
jgi:two-component system response regulator GlrR